MARPHPVTAMANYRRRRWARARRSFARGKITKRELVDRLAIPWNFPTTPLWQ